MNTKISQLVQLRLAYILTTTYGYDIIQFHPITQEMVLTNLKNRTYPVIKISIGVPDLSEHSIGYYTQYNPNGKVLVFSFASMHQKDSSFDVVGMSAEIPMPEHVLKHFPKLKELSYHTDNYEKDLKEIVDKQNKVTNKRRKQRAMNSLFNFGTGTKITLVICWVIFLLEVGLSFLTEYRTTPMIMMGALYMPFIQGAHEWFRILTAGFVHADALHLLANSYALINIGRMIEFQSSTKKFWTILLSSIIGGNLFVYIAEQNTPLTLGLSGGIYGLFAWMLIHFIDTGLIKIPGMKRQLAYVIGLNLFINFLPQISWLGHLGGFVCGGIVAIILSEGPRFKSFKPHLKIASVGLLIALIVLSIQRPLLNEQNIYVLTDNDVIVTSRKLKIPFYGDYLKSQLNSYYQEVFR